MRKLQRTALRYGVIFIIPQRLPLGNQFTNAFSVQFTLRTALFLRSTKSCPCTTITKKGAFNAPLSIQNKIRLRRTLVKVNPASRKVGAASACLGLSVAITDLAYQAE